MKFGPTTRDKKEDAGCGSNVWYGECNFVPVRINTETKTSEMKYRDGPETK